MSIVRDLDLHYELSYSVFNLDDMIQFDEPTENVLESFNNIWMVYNLYITMLENNKNYIVYFFIFYLNLVKIILSILSESTLKNAAFFCD